MSKSSRRRSRNKQRQRMAARAAVATTGTARTPTGPRRTAAALPRPPSRPHAARAAALAAEPGSADDLQALLGPSGIPNVFTIARRDLAAQLVTPVGWVVAALFTFLVSGLGFIATAVVSGVATMEGVFSVIASFLIVVLVPVVTMRLLAEERARGTLELLLTAPIRDWELVVAKWLAAFTFYVLLLATTLAYVAILRVYEPKLDLGLVAAEYAGLLLTGAAAVAVGVLASSVTRNQVIAFFLAMAALLVTCWWPPAGPLLQLAGGFTHFQPFVLGEVTLRDLVYFSTVALGALFLTTRIIASRRWR
jgi:ABC-2 type transport system permease protein